MTNPPPSREAAMKNLKAICEFACCPIGIEPHDTKIKKDVAERRKLIESYIQVLESHQMSAEVREFLTGVERIFAECLVKDIYPHKLQIMILYKELQSLMGVKDEKA